MTLSATTISSRDLASIRVMPGRLLISLALNFIVLSGVLLLMARWLVQDDELWVGFVAIAAMPPAVAIVPWTYLLGGDTLLSTLGMTAAYLAALVITPLMMTTLLGVELFDPVSVLLILGQLIVIPLIVSRLLILAKLSGHIKRWRGTVVNWSFFVVLSTIIGLNRDAFFREFDLLVQVSIVAIVATLVLAHVIELVSKALHVDQRTTISLMLIGTMKNYGLASGIVLTTFSERATIPASVCLVFAVLRMVWLGFHFRKTSEQ